MVVFVLNLAGEVVPIDLDLNDTENRWNDSWRDWPVFKGHDDRGRLIPDEIPFRHVLFHSNSMWIVGYETETGFCPPHQGYAAKRRVAFWELDRDQARKTLQSMGISPDPSQLIASCLQSQAAQAAPELAANGAEPNKPTQEDASACDQHETTKLTPGARAIAAAYDLKIEGKPVSLRSACERAGVDRSNLRRRYPEAVATIDRLSQPDRVPRRGVRDRRKGDVDGWDADEDD